MVKIKSILKYFNTKYPFKSAEEWDKSGFTFGSTAQNIDTVIVALDLTVAVFESAIQNKAGLIIVHHPFIFYDEEQDIKEAPYKKEIINRLKSTNIGVLSLHTNYDKTNKRTATKIAEHLGFQPISSKSIYGHVFNETINKAILSKILLQNFNLNIKETNIKDNVNYKKWGLLPGAGSAEDIVNLHKEGCEFIMVSDVKWSTWQTAYNDEIKIVEVSHSIEDVFTFDIATQLQTKWKNLTIVKENILQLK